MKGSCNCGAIRFEVTGQAQGASFCHCGQCRKQSGGLWSSAFVGEADIAITGAPRWYASSADAERGFCPTCGAFLFWRRAGEGTISFALGAVDGPTGLRLERHIFTAHKGDYYEIADDLPQREN